MTHGTMVPAGLLGYVWQCGNQKAMMAGWATR